MKTEVLPTVSDRFWRVVWADVAGIPAVAWVFVAATTTGMLGLLWDGAWHASWGRDTFFIPPHDMLYTAVGISLGLTYLVIVVGAFRPYDPAAWHVGRLQAAPGLWTVFLGCMILITAAPFDEWWHRTYGPDDGTGLWSPPHFAGMVGGLVANLGILALLRAWNREPGGQGSRPRGLRHLTVNDLVSHLILGYIMFEVAALSLNFYAIRHWYRTTGAVYPILMMLFTPAVMVAAQRVTRRAGTATLGGLVSYLFVGTVGTILKLAGYPIVVSLPVMILPMLIVLDLAYARYGDDRRAVAGAAVIGLVLFYFFEYWWAGLLNEGVFWPIGPALVSLPIAAVVAALSALSGLWLARRYLALIRREPREPDAAEGLAGAGASD
jgi:hypothetical protein